MDSVMERMSLARSASARTPSSSSASLSAPVASPRPAVIGHRGAPVGAPENTLASFGRAVRDGADALECDVHLSADGHLVVMHDSSIDRTASPHGPLCGGDIADLTRAQLDTVELGGGERIPSLDDYLDVCGGGAGRAVGAVVEVKAPAAARATALALRERFGTQPMPLPDGTPPAVIISFHPEALRTVRETAPEIPIGLLAAGVDDEVMQVLAELRAERVSVWIQTLEDGDADRAWAASGASLHVWTVNTPEHLDAALAADVASITTDDPGWVVRERDRRARTPGALPVA
ncbi:glycerophosphodiester phosphodiesterase family protein [Brachybacterium sp. ACRRE]|uniref:glycerophosphodiester phosphodiesterase n=1 Tax=Brachybacterium sp. ACRRE TaxID=2918184 RepID=UPI001EF39640|nr:glycerophosphodiester phosphodiesterase family protein [Brachybacterium sp. ACRRE]MCG7311054.1 glycerophosphodiester phosphodiesterase [Brachybacterium sp. ACRRE]